MVGKAKGVYKGYKARFWAPRYKISMKEKQAKKLNYMDKRDNFFPRTEKKFINGHKVQEKNTPQIGGGSEIAMSDITLAVCISSHKILLDQHGSEASPGRANPQDPVRISSEFGGFWGKKLPSFLPAGQRFLSVRFLRVGMVDSRRAKALSAAGGSFLPVTSGVEMM